MKKVSLIEATEAQLKAHICYSWAQSMLLEKVGNYGGYTPQDIDAEFEVVKETEKAYQVAVPVEKIDHDGNVDPCTQKVWNFWMPKSAFVA